MENKIDYQITKKVTVNPAVALNESLARASLWHQHIGPAVYSGIWMNIDKAMAAAVRNNALLVLGKR